MDKFVMSREEVYLKTPNFPVKAAIYYPGVKKAKTVGIYTTSRAELVVDDLPRVGYSYGKWLPEDYGSKFVILRGNIMSFEDFMFVDEKEYTPIFFLETGTSSEARIIKVFSGVEIQFRLDYENGENEYLRREDYGEKYIALQK